MPEKKIIIEFEARKLQVVDFKVLEERTSVPEDFQKESIKKYDSDFHVHIGYNIEKELLRSEFDLDISSVSGNEKEAKACHKFVFIFHYDGMQDLVKKEGGADKISSKLAIAVVSITHSMARGILLVKLKDTAFSDFILPVVKPQLETKTDN